MGSRRAARKRRRKRGFDHEAVYAQATDLALQGKLRDALSALEELYPKVGTNRLRALIHNDVAAIKVASGVGGSGEAGFSQAIEIDADCQVAQENLSFLTGEPIRQPQPVADSSPARIAILSFLFNWPSRGGGIIHTVELVKFLAAAGYQVQHIFAKFPKWGIGGVDSSLPIDSKCLEFDDTTWNVPAIQAAYRFAVENYDPDCVLITDTWNFKPYLAEAVNGYPYFLRQQALECLCPLNNLRLLTRSPADIRQCPTHQLQDPQACIDCLAQRAENSGPLHKLERSLCEVGSPVYLSKLRRAIRQAEAVLALNPSIAELIRPYAGRTEVVTWGMDPARFEFDRPKTRTGETVELFMAADVNELIKGFHVLQSAAAAIWQQRQDFEIVATGDPAGRVNEFTRFTGWLTQQELPLAIAAADVLIMPTVAQEGLGRTTVEAMALGKPVIASNIGGLPYTVADQQSGLLFEPGNAMELAHRIEQLLDDRELRARLGENGRRRFRAEFTWDAVISKHYAPLLEAAKRRKQQVAGK